MAIPNVLTPSTYQVDSKSHTLSELYVDGIPLRDLNTLYDLNTAALGAERWNSANRFWASPPRLPSDNRRDVLDIGLNTSKKVNHFSLQISKFPLRAWMQYYDERRKIWRPVRHKKSNKPIVINIRESVPKRISRDVRGSSQQHPHHKAAGHWSKVEYDTRPVNARRFRIVLKQRTSTAGPREIGTGKKIPFSLAVKDFQVGYKVTNKGDAITLNPGHTQVVEQAPTFSSTTDLLGSSVEMALVEYRASDMLWPTLQTMAGVPVAERDGTREVWKCEPQPIPSAVVNLYLDARDAKGDTSPVDRFFLDPTTSGPVVNIYYSSEDPDLSDGFAASDEPIRYPGLQPHGNVTPLPDGVGLGTLGDTIPGGDFGYIDIDNQMIQFDQTRDWWAGIIVQPVFDSTLAETRVMVATPNFSVQWNGVEGAWDFNIDGVSIRRDGVEFGSLFQIRFVVGRVGNRVFVYMADPWSSFGNASARGRLSEETLAADPRLGQTFRFGGELSADPAEVGRGAYILTGFVLKQESLLTPEGDSLLPANAAEFLSTPIDTYTVPSTLLDDDEEQWDYTRNTLIRSSSALQTGVGSRNPYGFLGGPGTNYENLVWTPINRDFRLHRGYYNFDPVQAKFFKFEFTNLVAQPYQSYEPTTRTVRLFTSDVLYRTRNRTVLRGAADVLPGVTVGKAHDEPLFSDQYRIGGIKDINRYYANYKPTEALVAGDPVTQERLGRVSAAFNFTEWRGGLAPREVQTKKHHYETVQIRHTSNLAYFVGLNEVRMFRVNYTAESDTDFYNFPFYDRDALADSEDTNPWSLGTSGGLLADGFGTVQTTSEPLLSRRNVRGVQFAAHQSRALQLLADPEFTDNTLTYWEPYGGASIEQTDDITSDIGSSVKVVRNAQGSFWYYMESLYSSWDMLDGLDRTWDGIEEGTDSESSFGGISGSAASYVQPSSGGRIHVAARVYATRELLSPLKLQLIDIDGQVLSEQDVMPRVGGVTEWFTSYTIGESGETIGADPTWAEVEVLDGPDTDWDYLESLGTWDAVTGGTISPYEGPVSARLVQSQPTFDDWFVDNISIYEDPIVWEFSNDGGATWYPAYDIRNNPNGVLLFPSEPGSLLDPANNLSLRWRVTSYRSGTRVSSLVIRPWYSTLPLGMPTRETLSYGGPNVSKYDQYPSIEDHAPFKAWHKPIPEDWWFLYRQWLLQGGVTNLDQEQGDDQVTVELVLSDNLIYQAISLPEIVLGEGIIAFGTTTVLGEALVISPTTSILGSAIVI